jgi:hypothetical protein
MILSTISYSPVSIIWISGVVDGMKQLNQVGRACTNHRLKAIINLTLILAKKQFKEVGALPYALIKR